MKAIYFFIIFILGPNFILSALWAESDSDQTILDGRTCPASLTCVNNYNDTWKNSKLDHLSTMDGRALTEIIEKKSNISEPQELNCIHEFYQCYRNSMAQKWGKEAMKYCDYSPARIDPNTILNWNKDELFQNVIGLYQGSPVNTNCSSKNSCCWAQKNLRWLLSFSQRMESAMFSSTNYECLPNGLTSSLNTAISLAQDMSKSMASDHSSPSPTDANICKNTDFISNLSALQNGTDSPEKLKNLFTQAEASYQAQKKQLEILIDTNKSTPIIKMCESKLKNSSFQWLRYILNKPILIDWSRDLIFRNTLLDYKNMGGDLFAEDEETSLLVRDFKNKVFNSCNNQSLIDSFQSAFGDNWQSSKLGLKTELKKNIILSKVSEIKSGKKSYSFDRCNLVHQNFFAKEELWPQPNVTNYYGLTCTVSCDLVVESDGDLSAKNFSTGAGCYFANSQSSDNLCQSKLKDLRKTQNW